MLNWVYTYIFSVGDATNQPELPMVLIKLPCQSVGLSSRTAKHQENTSSTRLSSLSYFLVICLKGNKSVLDRDASLAA